MIHTERNPTDFSRQTTGIKSTPHPKNQTEKHFTGSIDRRRSLCLALINYAEPPPTGGRASPSRPTPLQAAQQRRQARELARPRLRTCPTEETISKAKEVACSRPAVVFGMSYRGEMERGMRGTVHGDAAGAGAAGISSAGMNMASTSPDAVMKRQQQQQQQLQQESLLFGTPVAGGYKLSSGLRDSDSDGDGGGSGGGGAGGIEGRRREEKRIMAHGGAARKSESDRLEDIFASDEKMMSDLPPGSDDTWLRQARQDGGGGGDTPSRRRSSNWSTVNEMNGYDRSRETGHATKSPPEGRLGDSAEFLEAERRGNNERVESWLLDVRLETETAGTALRVSFCVVFFSVVSQL